MNATEFALYRNDFAYFSTQSGYEDIGEGTPQSKYPFKAPFSLGKGTDWIDEITRTAPYQNYSLSISGRSKRAATTPRWVTTIRRVSSTTAVCSASRGV